VGEFKISSGIKRLPTPAGTFRILEKVPLKTYAGERYYYPNAKWNLRFLKRYYIHGAYWHNNFGQPMSHGCVNVAYKDMESLYEFADVGTLVTIKQ
jgi:lipoprotein-anchoring transpeptidase ErfK/SrfK